METLISVEYARKLICDNIVPLSAVTLALEETNQLILAEAIIANMDMPAFPQSNMDGYAFEYQEGKTKYILTGEVAAGADQPFRFEKGSAIRIFTGAPIPAGADTVLMQEKAKVESGYLILPETGIQQGDHVRSVGADIKMGHQVLPSQTTVTPAIIGLLASIGIHQLPVYPMPKIGILVTGNELQKPGMPLGYGQVYESNSYTLAAALNQLQIKDITIVAAKDDLSQLTTQLNHLLELSDMVLITGGVSVGDYDFTLQAMKQSGVTTIFHKVKQKPGKPLLFGKKGNQIVFGLPGNPASVLSCFYEYVLPAIGLLSQRNIALKKLEVPLAHDFKKTEGLTHFLKAIYQHDKVTILTGQESFKLSAFVSANCLVVLPEQGSQFNAGDLVTIHLL